MRGETEETIRGRRMNRHPTFYEGSLTVLAVLTGFDISYEGYEIPLSKLKGSSAGLETDERNGDASDSLPQGTHHKGQAVRVIGG